ncbi:MAG: lipid-A-disaccharide synthase N-terminal domain-containing protein [Proteobacteria bacterium]|nr:lipid-A-disaccharide synthase N-terminal domain-containing protein [Pseudomonadota bacterium]
MNNETIWIGVGFLGQALFTGRFLVQWLQSERKGKSVIPMAFWYFSIGGGLTLLAYAIWRKDPVFILGQATGLFIYLRNLHLISRERKQNKSAEISTNPEQVSAIHR